MDTKRFATGTIVGGVVLMAFGWLIFSKLFAAFYAANAGSATGVDRTDQIVWAVAVGNLAYAALVTLVVQWRGSSVTIGKGAATGAIVGFLIWCTVDFIFYGSSNIATLTRTIVDPLLEIVHGGIGGAAIAAVLRGGATTTPSRT